MLFPFPVRAEESNKFRVSYELFYEVGENGLTKVIQNARLTNLTSQYYANEYINRIGNSQITDLRAFDKFGDLPIETKLTDGEEEIHIRFRDKVVGLGNSLDWSLTYQTSEIAVQHGRVWQINIPRPISLKNVADYQVNLKVPQSFGTAVYLKPQPEKTEEHSYIWDKSSIVSSGISAAFGEYQIYDFSLQYHLKNLEFYPQTAIVALPPDTDYQKIRLDKIYPSPAKVTLDPDGNWLASFPLSPREQLVAYASGSALVYPRPQFTEAADKLDKTSLLMAQKYWEVDNPEISKLSSKLGSVENIFHYVVDNLHYNTAKTDQNQPRLGAVKVLENPREAICMEFTDLFIALTRSLGVPAREIDGFAYTQDKKRQPVSLRRDILHAWPEYFDSQTSSWIMVDPTWENTTGGIDYFREMDVDHLALAIHGFSSTLPLPAGEYKLKESDQDINIGFNKQLSAEDFQPGKEDLILKFVLPENNISGKKVNGKILIRNTGPLLVVRSVLIVKSDFLPHNSSFSFGALPPGGETSVDISISPLPLNFRGEGIITAKVGNSRISQKLIFKPFYVQKAFLFALALILGIPGGLFLIAHKFRRLFFSQ